MRLLLVAVIFFYSAFAFARKPYDAEVVVSGESATVFATNLVDLSRELKSSSIQALIPVYTPTSETSINFNFRGVLADTMYPAGSTSLVVVIPQAGITETFTAATREDSFKLFRDFLRDGGTKHKLLQAYARYSPVDPIAGNPNSLLSQMAQSDFLLGRLTPLTGCSSCWNAQPTRHLFQLGASMERAFSKGFDTSSITIPLRYSFSNNRDTAFILDAPLTFNDNGGAYSLFGSVGLGLRVPITNFWDLTPIIRLGSGGSLDLCTSGAFFSAGLTSFLKCKIRDFVLSMTNSAGYYSSTNLWLTGVNFNYHLHNYVFKNGLTLSTCHLFTFCRRLVNMELSFVDTYIAREHLYIRHYDEVGIWVVANRLNECLLYDCASIGFSYLFGEKKFQGYSCNLLYQF